MNRRKFFGGCPDALCSWHRVIHENRKPIDVKKLMRQAGSVSGLYDYLYQLSYIAPMYMLKYGNKILNELSPGEKGMILLIFYLLVDKNETPLVIDQPEDNLDNQTIVDVLVNCVKYTRKRRQIFMVTHNPNLAVVCDADQIISSSIDKVNGNNVKYLCGAIENPSINPDVVNILEGTKIAFDIRGDKYLEIANKPKEK